MQTFYLRPPAAGGHLAPAAARLIPANQLRGFAALCVVVSHLVIVFWSMRPYVALLTSSPVLVQCSTPLFSALHTPWFNLGPFSVGVFFLISGLVIPISLEAHSRRRDRGGAPGWLGTAWAAGRARFLGRRDVHPRGGSGLATALHLAIEKPTAAMGRGRQ